MKKELDTLAKRNQEIDEMFMSLYADKTKGILTEQRFFRMIMAGAGFLSQAVIGLADIVCPVNRLPLLRFFRMTETLEQEQADNKARMQAITDELRSASDTEDDVRRFIGEIREYDG